MVPCSVLQSRTNLLPNQRPEGGKASGTVFLCVPPVKNKDTCRKQYTKTGTAAQACASYSLELRSKELRGMVMVGYRKP